MRILRPPVLLVALLAASGASAQPALVCAPAAAQATRPCDAFHYHIQMYRPDTRQFVEVTGLTPFATQAACDRAREAQVNANTAIVTFFRTTRQQQYEGDRIGPCHCDLTTDRSSSSFLPEPQRTLQLRNAEEARLRVRERLIDNKIPTDSELIRGLYADPPVTPLLGAPRVVSMPQIAPVAVMPSPDDLRPTRTVDNAKPAVAALDLPLAEVGGVEATPPAPIPQTAAVPELTPTPTDPPAPQPAEPPITETVVKVESNEPAADPAQPIPATNGAGGDDSLNAEEVAERFVSYETQRIQNILKASAGIADENVKSKIFEACMQRIQLLSNLRQLIEGSGTRSTLTAAARDASTEEERLRLIARLFGEGIEPHWAPKDASDVVVEIDPDVAAIAERVLRDTAGRFTPQQKRQALYLVLAQTQPTEDQRLWLSTVVENLLR
jgi:hypothetical protein